MPKLIGGFLLGVAATLAVIFWLDENTPEAQVNLSSHASLGNESPDVSRSNPADAIATATDMGGDDSANSTSPDLASSVEPMALEAHSVVAPGRNVTPASPSREPPASATSVEFPREIADMIENMCRQGIAGAI